MGRGGPRYIDANSDGLVSLADMDPVSQHAYIQQEEKYEVAIHQAEESPKLKQAHYSKPKPRNPLHFDILKAG